MTGWCRSISQMAVAHSTHLPSLKALDTVPKAMRACGTSSERSLLATITTGTAVSGRQPRATAPYQAP